MVNRKLLFPALVLLTLTIILPLGSWYYLNSGLKYRKGIQKEIQVKSSFDQTTVFQDIQKAQPESNITEIIKGKANIILIYSDQIEEIVNPIFEQFSKADKFQIICFSQDPVTLPIWKNVLTELPIEQDNQIHLVNHLGDYIGSYSLEKDSIKKLIEHTAIIIPRKVEKDIINKK